jgi:hypothetical protein
MAGQPSTIHAVMFTDSPSTADEAAFIKRNDPSATDITTLVQQGFLVRTRGDAETQEALLNDATRRDLAFSTGAQFVSTDYPVPDLSLSDYSVVFADDMSFRCNPVNSSPGCTFVPEPSLALLQLTVLGTLLGVRTLRSRE